MLVSNNWLIMNTKYLFICSLFAILIACKSDNEFLSENPETDYTIENAFTTSEQVDQIILGCYYQVRNMMCTDGNAVILKGNGTDVLDVPLMRMNDTFADYSKVHPLNTKIKSLFDNFYKLIQRANLALYVSGLPHIKWASEDTKKYVVAQAKFFRAYAYRNLGELWGGVPLVLQMYFEPKYDFVRSTRLETYQCAIDDLEAALPDLPEQTEQGGRIVKGAAQHYLCELYLAKGIEEEQNGTSGSDSFDKSILYGDMIINGSIYNLMTERFGTRKDEADKSVWWDLFRLGNVNYQDGNRECIWAFQIDFDAYLAEDKKSYLPYPRNYMPVLRNIEGFEGMAEDAGGRGIASVTPNFYIRETIWEGELWNDMRNAEHNITRTIYYNDPKYPDLIGKPIPYSVMYKNDDFKSKCFPLFMKLTTDKFIGLDQGENRSNIFRDDYAIRLPETILLRAEAYLRKGDKVRACDDINLIRDRAKCTYRITPDKVDLDFILDERARELYVEECRWNTLLRMGGTVAVDRIRKYAMWPVTKATLTFDYNLWPIPQAVIDRNMQAVIEQNPGWDNR